MNIFLNSFPKSGTNLVQKCLELGGAKYSGRSLAASSGLGRYERVKKCLRGPCANEVPVELGMEAPICVSPKWLCSYLRNADGYVSGHAVFSDHLHKILINREFNNIQVIRHPCAIWVSWANYIAEAGYYWKTAHNFLKQKPFEERAHFLLYGGFLGDDSLFYRGFKDLFVRIQGWFESGHALVVKYEDLVGSKGGGSDEQQFRTISLIHDYIGNESSEAMIAGIASKLYGGTHTFRKGSIHGWKEAITDEMEAEIWDELSGIQFLNRLGYMR